MSADREIIVPELPQDVPRQPFGLLSSQLPEWFLKTFLKIIPSPESVLRSSVRWKSLAFPIYACCYNVYWDMAWSWG